MSNVEQILGEFVKTYFLEDKNSPYREYVSLIAIYYRPRNFDDTVPEEEKFDPKILIGLLKPLPPELCLPTKYKGIRVFVKVVGLSQAL